MFKKIADHIYNHYLSKASDKKIQEDTLLHQYYGMKSDLNAIFSSVDVAYKDSLESGVWREADMYKNKAALTQPAQLITKGNITPDVKGMGLKDALYLLENKGMIALVSGKGKVVSQSIAAGTNFKKGQKIYLMLN